MFFIVVHPKLDLETESHKRDGWICGSIRSSRERPLAHLWSTQKNVVGGNVAVRLSDFLLKASCSFEYFQNRALSCARLLLVQLRCWRMRKPGQVWKVG